MINQSIIRKYDIRGIVGDNLHANDAYEIGRKFANYFSPNINICVGYDGRVHSPTLIHSLIQGLADEGASVLMVGLCTSPILHFTNKITNSNGGIIVTASHNTAEYNGFKFASNNIIFGEEEIKSFLSQNMKKKSNVTEGTIIRVNINNCYINMLKKVISTHNSNNKLKIAWDSSNGALGHLITQIPQILPNHEHIIINHKIDGTFPAHNPDISLPENLLNLIEIVKKNKCDLGIAFDGDGDRISLIDNLGTIVSSDHLIMILVKYILTNYPKSKIVIDIKGSMKIFDIIKEYGGKGIICPTGHSLIKEKMLSENAQFAGEVSGHLFFAELGFDDGLYAAMKIIDILLQEKDTLANIVSGLPKLHITPEIKVKICENKKFLVIDELKKILIHDKIPFSDIDGVRVNINNNYWWLIRASNTQNYITARCEGKSEEDLKYANEMLSSYMKKIMPDYEHQPLNSTT